MAFSFVAAVILLAAPMPHPARAVLASRRITNRTIARRLGYSEGWVSRCLLGHDQPSAEFQQALAELLDLPTVVLFREDSAPGNDLGEVEEIEAVLG